jgi:PIN domain nuclease of toxin-antitoxin system
MLVAKGRLHLEQTPMQWRRTWLAAGLAEWLLSGSIGIGAVHLDGLHADPADRLIVATALDMGAALLTADERLLAWSGPLTCVDARR